MSQARGRRQGVGGHPERPCFPFFLALLREAPLPPKLVISFRRKGAVSSMSPEGGETRSPGREPWEPEKRKPSVHLNVRAPPSPPPGLTPGARSLTALRAHRALVRPVHTAEPPPLALQPPA